jgi:hypothetical protein
MVGLQPCSSHSLKLPSLLMAEAWGVNSPTGQMVWAFFHTNYLIVMHCHHFSVSVAVVLTLVFIGLAETAPADWTHSERFLFALFYLFWAWCLITVHCNWSGFPSCPQSPPLVTIICILLRQEVLWLRLYFSILFIPVQALSLGYALTITPLI